MLPGRDPDRGSDIDPYDSCQSTARAPKAGGVKLGGHAENLKIAELGRRKAAARTADLIPVIEAIRAEGISAAVGIAKALNDRGIPTTRGLPVAGRAGATCA